MDDQPLRVLVVAQHDNSQVSMETLRTIKAASLLIMSSEQHDKGDVSVFVAGHSCETVVDSITAISGVDKVIAADSSDHQYRLAENMAELIAEIGQDYSHLLAPATTFGKDLMPRVAALLEVGQLSDVVEIQTPDIVIRPIYAGNALAKVKSLDSIKVITIRSSAFDAIESEELVCSEDKKAKIERWDKSIKAQSTEFVSQLKVESERPELPEARVVISGGRGLGSQEHFGLIEQLADKLGGAIGASRAAVDAGFVSNDLQVGQTGKIVAPELYIAVGISGAIQHLAGMKESKVIVAINSDPDAPIFQVADYGIVGDLFEIMPELIRSV
ncbi:electron transfer flavoprotein subunit alpha/FixB family protein [Vibrio sp. 03-59-1]|uniref:electron transfer flavoprotein subunit alpha/FixB family protein n=1 Tax=Vibrio sp. 03-59-1 TaxID=2607607 RepID=UPI001493874A|nr:FAD-binding protein [Vibrio sp. 03-59-1]NOH82593.1 electron transfer flavoprotein subunit alpha/FixB family protein [Vibrio sp. 03-59-1]